MSKIDYSKILIQPPEGRSTCHVFVLDLPLNDDPGNGERAEKLSGQIFGLIEIEAAPTRKINSFINALVQEIRIAALSSFGKPQTSADTAFENLIQKTNYRYIELIGNKSSFVQDAEEKTTIPNINAVMVFENEKNLYLAQKGRISPLLIYQSKPQIYKIINITETASGREGRASNINLFTNIVSGRMNVEDYLIFTTESLLDYFSLEKICKTVSSASPEKSSELLKQTLAETTNPQTAFAAVILKLRPDSKPKIAPIAQISEQKQISLPQNSMAGFLRTAANTEKMLTPSLGLNLGVSVASFFNRIKNIFKKKNEIKNNARLEYYSSQFNQPSRSNKFLKTISLILITLIRIPYFILKQLIVVILNLLKIIFYLLTNKNGLRKTTIENASHDLREGVGNLKNKFGKMPRLSRALFVFAIIFVFLFVSSTVLLYYNYQNQVASESLNQKIEDIQNKKSAAEASLIYDDEAGARKSLSEALALLNEFPQKTKNEKQAHQNLTQSISSLQDKLRHVVKIDEPTLLADISKQNQNAETGGFVILKDNLYAPDRFIQTVYKINLENGEITNKDTLQTKLTLGFPQDETSAIFYQPEKKFFIFNFDKETSEEINVALNENENSVQSLAIYNQKLYILDPAANQIWRHVRTLDGFSQGTPWIKGDINLGDAVSFAIDGSIFVLKSNGEIVKLSNGQKIDFPVSVDPAISSPKKIMTSPSSNYLYILEPTGKRLVVLDKDGKLKAQYFSEKFDDLKDFFVSETEKIIYLLSGNKIYSISASHL